MCTEIVKNHVSCGSVSRWTGMVNGCIYWRGVHQTGMGNYVSRRFLEKLLIKFGPLGFSLNAISRYRPLFPCSGPMVRGSVSWPLGQRARAQRAEGLSPQGPPLRGGNRPEPTFTGTRSNAQRTRALPVCPT